MGNSEIPHAGNHRRIDACLEMELQLKSLRSLLCDLLKSNQELRTALRDAKANLPHNQEP
jgi:hypothetical protein